MLIDKHTNRETTFIADLPTALKTIVAKHNKTWYISFKELNHKVMAKTISILLGNHFDKFIHSQMKTGKYSSVSEVVNAALRIFEHEETKKSELITQLKEGEKSGFSANFERNAFRKKLHQKYAAK